MQLVSKQFLSSASRVFTIALALVWGTHGEMLQAWDDDVGPVLGNLTDDEPAEPTSDELPEDGLRVSRNLQPPAPLRPPVNQQSEIPLPQAGRELSQRLLTSPSNDLRIASGSPI